MSQRRELSSYEKRRIELIEHWMAAPPSHITRGYRAAKNAAGSVIQRVLPDGAVEKFAANAGPVVAYMQRAVPKGAIQGAINGNLWLANRWTREKTILRELGVENFDDLESLSLERLDALADKAQNFAIAAGGAAGAAGGAGGVFFAAPSIVAIVNLTMRTIRQIGLCYGYSEYDHIERAHMMEILSLIGGSGDQGAKFASSKFLHETLVMVKRTTFKKMAERVAAENAIKEMFILQSRSVAKQLGTQLTKSRIQAGIPLLGGGIGLLLDGNYMRKVGWTARHYYQRRWLQDRGLWPETLDQPPPGLDDQPPTAD